MAYLLLPSSRLALYIAQKHQLRVLPIRAEQYVSNSKEGNNLIAVSYLKSLTFYHSDHFHKIEKDSDLKPLSSIQFNKKIEGLTTNKKGLFYVSDKFGDIYSISDNFQQKYMNSNLGIPTFLQHISHKDKSYMVVCDEDARIKIYNESRMHQIISFWFLIRRVPLQVMQTTQNSLVFLVKKQNQINLQMQEEVEEFVELYHLKSSQLEEAQFSGKLFYVSMEKDEVEECKYQTITSSKDGTLHLLKLFSQNITVVSFSLKAETYELHSTKNVSIEEGDWDYLYVQPIVSGNKPSLLISFGKSHIYDETKEAPLEDKEMIKMENFELCTVNKNEHLILLEL